jgi:putative transposase
LLTDLIADIHRRSRGTYGRLRIRAALEIEQGLVVNKKLIAKIMAELGIHGLPGTKKGVKNLKNISTCEDLVQRNFVATQPNELWLTDITEHQTREGKLYCCVVLDLYSRRVVGWSISRHCDTDLVLTALSKAGSSRTTSAKTIIHSDHGTQFTSWAFTENIRRHELMGSMGTTGDSGGRCRSNCSIARDRGQQSSSFPRRLPITSRTSTTRPGGTARLST